VDEKAGQLFDLVGMTRPHLWGDAIDAQWVRINEAREDLRSLPPFRDTTMEEVRIVYRLTREAHFLLIAIRQLLMAQEWCVEQTGDERLVRARAAFNAAVPHAWDFRDFLEHLDDYLRNRGNLQAKVGHGVDLVVEHERRTGRLTLELGSYQLDVDGAAGAALELAEVTVDVWGDYVIGELEDGGSSVKLR
jgi:hypothetical protein